MRYVLLLAEPDPSARDRATEEERAAVIETARLLPPRYTVEIRPVVPVEPS